MCVYIHIIDDTVFERRLNNNTWAFETKPKLPLQRCIEISEIGWDIPTRCALDNSGQWWVDNRHGHRLEKIDTPPYLGPEVTWTAKKSQESG